MGKYLLENIHVQFPEARLGIVVASRGAMIRDLLAGYPWLEVIEANRRSPRALLSLFKRFYGSDLVVTQYAGKQGGSFGFASKIVARLLAKRGGLVGFIDTSKWNTVLYNHLISVRSDKSVDEHDREALRAVELLVSIPFPELAYMSDESVLAKYKLTKGNYIIMHFFASNKGRSISLEKGRELLTALHARLPDVQLVMTGSEAEKERAEYVAKDFPQVQIVAGKVSLQEVMNLIKGSAGVISVDTGIAHIAAQLGTQLTVLRTCLGTNWWLSEQYGAYAPITVFSHDESCVAGHEYKDYPTCINGIDMGQVAEKIRKYTV